MSMRHMVAAGGLFALSALVAGCGDSSNGNNGTGFPVSEQGPVVNDTPQATIEVTRSLAGANLVLLSSNLVPHPESSLNYVEWFGEVRNDGLTPACFVTAKLDFYDALGTIFLTLDDYADSDTYDLGSGSSLSASCIPPGKTGGFWTNDLPPAQVLISSVARIQISLDLTAISGAVPHPARPMLSGVDLIADPDLGAGYWSVAGTMIATQTIHNIMVTALFKDASGLVLDRGTDVNLGTIPAASSWPFTTTSYEGLVKPSSYLLFYDFLTGAGDAAAMTSSGAPVGMELAATVATDELRARDLSQTMRLARRQKEARAALARSAH